MKRTLLATTTILLAACTGGVDSGVGPVEQPLVVDGYSAVSTKTVCFTGHNPGDPLDVPITGTLYYKGSYSSDTPFVLAVHGAASNRAWWDGSIPGPTVTGSIARTLATENFAVVAIDKLGYGDSAYARPPGAGYSISFASQASVFHEVVTQLKAGTYTESLAGCPAGTPATVAAKKVALLGHSIGGGESMFYAGNYNDIDAVIPIAWTNQGLPSTVINLFFGNVLPQAFSGHDYVYFFAPGDNGISQQCVGGVFYAPGSKPEVYNTVCANANLGPTPAGELLSAQGLIEANHASIPHVGPTPALLVFGDNDNFVTDADNTTGDPDLVTGEVNEWKANCGCDVSTYIQPNAGHAEPLHNSNGTLARAIASWLHQKGF